MKELIEKAIRLGKKGCVDGLKRSPFLSKEFMEIVPNCSFGDDIGCKIRTKLYKAYIKGFTEEMLRD